MTNSFERVRNFYRSEGFDLGEKQGIDLGRKQGIDLGKRQGIELGEERGKQERSVEIARNLLSMRMAKPEVAKATGGGARIIVIWLRLPSRQPLTGFIWIGLSFYPRR